MIYELLSTALLACSLGAGNYRNEPKRAIDSSNPYLCTYSVAVNKYASDGFIYRFWEDGREQSANNPVPWGSTYTFEGLYSYASFTPQQDGNDTKVSIFITFKDTLAGRRILESFWLMQEQKTYALNGFEIDEFNNEGVPDISLYTEASTSTTYTRDASFTFPVVYSVSFETFGTEESDSMIWVKRGASFTKVFNSKTNYAFYLSDLNAVAQVSTVEVFSDYSVSTDNPATGEYASFFATKLTLSVGQGFLTKDLNFKISATPLVNGLRGAYNDGYEDGKIEGQTPVSWIRTTFDGIAGFFNIQVFPFVTLGFLCFAPLIVVAIIAILRIIKHE